MVMLIKSHQFVTAPPPGGTLFTDSFDGTGALNVSDWTVGGFSSIERVSGIASAPEYAWACLTGHPMTTPAQYAQVTKTGGGSINLILSSTATSWTFPSPTEGYTILSRGDGVAEAFTRGASLGYGFITPAAAGVVVRAEHDGAGNLTLLHDGVVMRTWDDPDATWTGAYVWVGGGPSEFDNFEAGDL